MLTVQHLKIALSKAAASDESAIAIGRLHSERSAAWVGCLAEELRTCCDGPGITVFSKYDKRNRDRFGLNELLYDIAICETSTLNSPGRGKPLHFISKALWQVESELAEGDSTQWVEDFNKLVLGAAENKLFIGPEMQKKSLDSLLPVAKCCSGNVYVATIPHPGKWNPEALNVALWKFLDNQWLQL